MKYFALFVSILAGLLAARKVRETDFPAFFDAINDAAEETKVEIQAEVTREISRPSIPEAVESFAQEITAPIRYVFGTKYDALIKQSAEENNIPPDVLYRLLYQESRFRDDIITGKTKSPAGALGIAQFMPATAVEWLGSVDAALNPAVAIPGAARYLAWLRRQFGGDLKLAVAAYNWGIGNVKNRGIDKAPRETRQYVAAILPGQSIG